jgi:hypothetical protein
MDGGFASEEVLDCTNTFKLIYQKVIISLYHTTKSAKVSKSDCYQIQTYGTGRTRFFYGEEERSKKILAKGF